MDHGLEDQFGLPAKMIAFTSAAIGCGLLLLIRKMKKERQSAKQQFKWSIWRNNTSEVNKIKHGKGLKQLKMFGPEVFTYLYIEQQKLNIMKTIQNWHLSSLVRLYLMRNNIESIQAIASIEMPNLEVLVLSYNQITSVRSLRKIKSTSLAWLDLQSNKLTENMEYLTQMNSANLFYFWMEFFENDSTYHDHVRWLAKMESVVLSKLHISSSSRISDKSFIASLKRKYDKLDVRICKF